MFAAAGRHKPRERFRHEASERRRAHIIGAVQSVFEVAAPLAAIALGVVLLLEKLPLRGPGDRSRAERQAEQSTRVGPLDPERATTLVAARGPTGRTTGWVSGPLLLDLGAGGG